MNQTPLNPDAEVNKDQTIFAYEAAERDYPQYGSIMLKLHHSNFQSSLWQISKRTAESLRDQLNDLVAAAQPAVNSVECTPRAAFYVELNIDASGNATQTNGKSFYSWLENVRAEAWDEGQVAGRNNEHHTNWTTPISNPYRPESNDA